MNTCKKWITAGCIAFTLLAFSSCVSIKNNGIQAGGSDSMISNGKLFTAVWMQQSAEYKALCLQAFQLADLRLAGILTNQKPAKPLAIITDIDETFLDNSPYAIHQSLQGKDFDPATWNKWVEKAGADTIAGGLAFFQKAASQGVTIFYVTNRDRAGRAATLKNLQKFNFPNADDAHLLTMDKSSSKEERRQKIARDYTIALLLGDNLADFSPLFDNHPNSADRTAAVMALKEQFGKKFIILPNPNYGDWENALYNYKHGLNAAEKAAAFRRAGKRY